MATNLGLKNFIKYVINLPPDEGPDSIDTGQDLLTAQDPVKHAKWLTDIISTTPADQDRAFTEAKIPPVDVAALRPLLNQLRLQTGVRKGRDRRVSSTTFWSYGYEQFSRKLAAERDRATRESSVKVTTAALTELAVRSGIDPDDPNQDVNTVMTINMTVGEFRQFRTDLLMSGGVPREEAEAENFISKTQKAMATLAAEAGY